MLLPPELTNVKQASALTDWGMFLTNTAYLFDRYICISVCIYLYMYIYIYIYTYVYIHIHIERKTYVCIHVSVNLSRVHPNPKTLAFCVSVFVGCYRNHGWVGLLHFFFMEAQEKIWTCVFVFCIYMCVCVSIFAHPPSSIPLGTTAESA